MSNTINQVMVNGNTYEIEAQDTSGMLAPAEDDPSSASRAYAVDKHLITNNHYYKVIAAISVGDALVATGANANIEEDTISNEIEEVNADLSVFSFRVNNGVPQFSIDGGTTWSKMGGSSMLLNFANKKEITTTEFTSTKDGAIIGCLGYQQGTSLAINNSNIITPDSNTEFADVYIYGVPSGSKIKLTGSNYNNRKLWFVPYAD